MKKTTYVLLIFMAFILVACGQPDIDVDDNIEDEQSQKNNMDVDSDSDADMDDDSDADEDDGTDKVDFAEIPEDAVCGIEFLGYGQYYNDIPFMDYLTKEQYESLNIFLYEGDEYYLIVPNGEDILIEVYNIIDGGEEGMDVMGGNFSMTKPGTPVLLRCNVSDIHPNTSIWVGNKEDKHTSFKPSCDLASGKAVLSEGVYDLEPRYIDEEKISDAVSIGTENYSILIDELLAKNISTDIITTEADGNRLSITYIGYEPEQKNVQLGYYDIVKTPLFGDKILSGVMTPEDEQKYMIYRPNYTSYDEMGDDIKFAEEYNSACTKVEVAFSTIEMMNGYTLNNSAYVVNPYEVIHTFLGAAIESYSLMEEEPLYIDGRLCTVISAGTDSADKFTKEFFYAVSTDGIIYEYSVIDDNWYALNPIM